MTKISIIKSVFLPQEVNGMNLISYLAERGDDNAVQTLIDNGEKIEDAAYGYAIAGNKAQLECLLETTDFYIGKMIRGFARASKIDELKKYNSHKDESLIGFAQAGNLAKVTFILDQDISLFTKAVEGYASGNHGQLLTKLIKGTNCYPLAIYHAARSSHTDLVNNLLAQCGVNCESMLSGATSLNFTISKDINAYALLNIALKGYIEGRHFKDAVKLLECGACFMQAVLGLKDSNGLPNHELYLAFLAYIKDAALSTKVLDQMLMQAEVTESLTITEFDQEKLQRVINCMDEFNLNYIEAVNQVDFGTENLVTGEITLAYLADVVVKSDISKIVQNAKFDYLKKLF